MSTKFFQPPHLFHPFHHAQQEHHQERMYHPSFLPTTDAVGRNDGWYMTATGISLVLIPAPYFTNDVGSLLVLAPKSTLWANSTTPFAVTVVVRSPKMMSSSRQNSPDGKQYRQSRADQWFRSGYWYSPIEIKGMTETDGG